MKKPSTIRNTAFFVLGVSLLTMAGCGSQKSTGNGADNSAVKSEESQTKVAANWCARTWSARGHLCPVQRQSGRGLQTEG